MTCETVARSALGSPVSNRGTELLFRCPRHDDQHPSLQISTSKDVWPCGPCGVGGTAWKLAAFLAGCDPSDKKTVNQCLQEHGLSSNRRRANTSYAAKTVAAIYRYTDFDGTLLLDNSTFKQVRLLSPADLFLPDHFLETQLEVMA